MKRLDCLVDLPVEMMVELATLAKALHGAEAPMSLNSRELTSTDRADRAYKWRGPWQGGESLLLKVDLLLEIEDLPSSLVADPLRKAQSIRSRHLVAFLFFCHCHTARIYVT